MESVYFEDIEKSFSNVPRVKELEDKQILITGANGLICSSVVDFLMMLNREKKMNIHVIAACRSEDKFRKRFYRYRSDRHLQYLNYDATQPFASSEEFDYVIHGAGNANPAMYTTEPVETMIANLNGINELLKYGKKHQNCRILYISSSEVYGNKDNRESYSEKDFGSVDLSNPRACYPSSKRAAESLCVSYASEYGTDTVIVRPGHVYGPTAGANDNRASSEFPREVNEGKDIIMKSSGAQLRSYCYCVDCASAILTVLINGKTPEAYNISNPDSIVSIREMAEAFAKAGNKRIIFENPSDYEKSGYNLMENSSLDSKKIESLGWHGMYDMNTGAQHTLTEMKMTDEQI